MSEWWTYSPADFLMFSPRTYRRLFELANQELWPAHLAAFILGLAVMALLWRGRGRAAGLLLALAWIWVAWAFLHERYATISTAAPGFALGFAAQAVLLALLGAFLRRRSPAGLALVALGIAYPLVALAAGRGWAQAEAFGMAPDPTAVATLGVALHGVGVMRWVLLFVPVLWCVVTGTTLWTLGAPEAPLAPAAALLAMVLAALGRRV